MEIEEVEDHIAPVDTSLEAIIRNQSVPPESAVYVAVGKGNSSMNALSWVLQHETPHSSKLVYLIHIFPEIRHIPTPLGNIERSKVNPEQIEAHMITVRSKRRELLHKFINVCYSAKVEVDTILIESGQIAKAILELIPVLQIPTLVIGASKSNARKLKKGLRGGKEEQILEGAPDYCKVKIISEGKEITATEDQISPSPSTSTSNSSQKLEKNGNKGKEYQLKDKVEDSVGWCCFPGVSCSLR